MKYIKGTNQFKKRRKENWRYTLFVGLTFIVFLCVLGATIRKEAIENVYAQEALLSPIAEPTPTPEIPTLNPNITERDQNIALIKRIWGKDSDIGLAIARCESGYRTHARNINTNTTIDQGIYQVNSIHTMPEMEIAVANISYAYIMYQQQGSNPWNSSKHCWSK